MPKFAVHLHGTGCWFAIEDEAVRQWGFHTVRFVETRTADEASAQVVKSVQAEIQSMYRDGYPRSIEVEEVLEDPKRFDELGPGAGFTWYPVEVNEPRGH